MSALSQVVLPDLPSAAVRFKGQATTQLPPAFNQVVAVIATHNWGPVGLAGNGGDPYLTLQDWEADYGTDLTPARKGVIGALNGMGLEGARGAGGVIFYRNALLSALAPAAHTFMNTAGTPANALRVTALYSGTRGNDVSIVIEDDPIDASKDRLRVLFRGATVEQFSYVQTDVAALAAAVAARPSRYITAASLASGTALAHTAGTALSGGNDGSAVTPSEFAVAQGALEYSDFGIFSPAGLEDVPTKVQLAVWAATMAAEMRPFRVVFGGRAGESLDDAISELTSNPELQDEHVSRLAVGTWHDDLLDSDLSTAELAPRYAGVLAARGERASGTRALLAGLTVVGSTGPTTDELVAGRNAGLTMIRRVSNAQADVAISQAVTTFIDPTVTDKPLAFYSDPRIIGILDRIVREMTEWGDDNVVGSLPVTDETRDLVRKEVLKTLEALETSGLADPGSSYVNVDPPSDPALADAIPYTFGFRPARTANYVVGEGTIR